jgi:hypothetical protein
MSSTSSLPGQTTSTFNLFSITSKKASALTSRSLRIVQSSPSSQSGSFDSPLESLFEFDPQVFFGTLQPLGPVLSPFPTESHNRVSGFSNPRCHKSQLPRIPDLDIPMRSLFALGPPGYAPSPRNLLLYDRSHTSYRDSGFRMSKCIKPLVHGIPDFPILGLPINDSSFQEISRKLRSRPRVLKDGRSSPLRGFHRGNSRCLVMMR